MSSSIAAQFDNINKTGGVTLEEESSYDPNFELICKIIGTVKPNLLNQRQTTQEICAENSDSFITNIPPDLPRDVISAHQDISKLFPDWHVALNSSDEINLLILAGNGSKVIVCNMFTTYLSEMPDLNVLEINPNSPSFKTPAAIRLVNQILNEEDSSSNLTIILHSADLPAAQDFIYGYLLPLRDQEPRLKLVFALDTLLIHAQIQLWGIRNKYILKDGIHTFLDFRLELLQTWLQKRPIIRQLLGESLSVSQFPLNEILDITNLSEFCIAASKDCDESYGGDSEEDEIASVASDSEAEEVTKSISSQRPHTAPTTTSNLSRGHEVERMTTRSRAR